MKNTTLGFAIALLLSSQTSYALTPWTNKAPDIAIYTSGASVQDKAYGQVIITTLAAPNSVDYFADVDPATGSVGTRWTAYYFTGNANLGSGLAGKKILLEKRAYGSSGYGVVPLIASLPLEHLNVVDTTASAWTANGTGAWKATISSTNASNYLMKQVSDAGFSGVDPNILLKPNTENYPEQVVELMTGLPENNWSLNIKQVPVMGSNAFAIVPTGGSIYGMAVTLDLYKVLQAAQKRAGSLSSSAVMGGYSEKDLPSLNRNIVGSLLAGKIGAWEQFKIVDKTDGTAKSLLDPAILSDAGVSAPYKESTTGNNLTPVAVGKRNNGAAAGVVAYARFLNYPTTPYAVAPAPIVGNDPVEEDASLPIVKAPLSLSDTGSLLKDWQNGTNTIGLNTVSDGATYAKRWGIAVNSVDKNSTVLADGTGGDPWRYIKIDGYAPTLENVAAGVYPIWTEGAMLYRYNKATDKLWGVKSKLLKTLADNLSSPTVIGAFNTTQAWGKTGAFTTTADPRGFKTSVPFDASNPVIPFSHRSGNTIHDEIVPTADANAKGGLVLQLK